MEEISAPEKSASAGRGGKRTFIAGLCGGADLVGAVWAAASWLQDTKPNLTAYGEYMYDQCLMTQNGNRVACNAYMRVMVHQQEEEAAKKFWKQRAAELGAAGQSKREVVEWARKQGLSDIETSEITGIPISDLAAGKY